MSDVFISYAREDRTFVQRLHGALSSDGHQAWVDWEGIPASAKWMAEVRGAIDASDCFCFVVSPDSVESPVCREEAAHAAASNKRIVPLLYREVPDELVPETVAAHNWIAFTDGFDEAFATLVRALETEPEHLHAHTRLLVRSKEWEASGDRSHLLRGSDLSGAEAWLASASGKEPAPTQGQTAYVLASRKAASRRQRTTVGAVAIALAISLVLSAVAVIQRGEAIDQRTAAEAAQADAEEQRATAERNEATAEEQADLALSRQLASQALLNLERQPDLAILLALEGYGVAATEEAHEALLATARLTSTIETVMHAEGDSVVRPDLSAAGILATSDRRGAVRLWTLADGSSREINFGDGTDWAKSIAFDGSGNTLAVAYRRNIELFDVATGAAIPPRLRIPPPAFDIDGEDTQAFSLVFDPTGTYLASGGTDGRVRIWDLDRGRLVARFDASEADLPVADVAFSPDGRLLAAARDEGGARLWSAPRWRPAGDVAVERWTTDVEFSPDGAILATVGYPGLQRWDAQTLEPVGPPIHGPEGELRSVAFSPDGRLVATGGTDAMVRLWDPGAGTPLGQAIGGHDDTVTWLDFTSNGSGIVTAPGTVIVVHRVDGVLGIPLGSGNENPFEMAFAPSGETLAVAGGPVRRVYLFDPATKAPSAPALEHEVNAWSVDYSPDGLLAASDGELVRIWDPESATEVTEPLSAPRGGQVSQLDFSADGETLAVGMIHKWVVLWRTDTWEQLGVVRGAGTGEVGQVGFSPDGRTLYSLAAQTGTLTRWDVATLEQIGAPVVVPGARLFDVAPVTGEIAWAGFVQPLVRYDAELGSLPAFPTDAGRTWSTSFTTDGRVLALGGDDGSVRMFDVSTGEEIGDPLGAHADWVVSVAFSPDGSWLASGGQDATIRIWDGVLWSDDLEAFRATLCPLAARNLTEEEWERYLPGTPYVETCPAPA